MGSDEKNSLLNQTQFAKRCGVSISTIRTYVTEGKIVPAKEVENRVFFTPDQVYDIKVLGIKKLVNQSFLCVVCEEDEARVKHVEERMLVDISKTCPNAEAIKSLPLSAKAMMEKPEPAITDNVLDVIKSKVISSFVNEVRLTISSIICNIYTEEAFARSFTFDFFLSYICDNNCDSALVEAYNNCSLSNVTHSLDSVKQRCQLQFTNIASRYGVYTVCNSTNFGIYNAFAEDGSTLMKSNEFMFDSSSPNAKDIKEKTLGTSIGDSVTQGLTKLCRNGFYSVIDGVGSISDEDCADIVAKLASREYKTIYSSSLEKLPKIIATSLDAYSKAGYIRVEYYQG